ncbi:hydrogenase iron-sulfur subunit [Chloroflexales bacterium ZM16-3]|nr:hydrogenase iron-sulfur subunit [Chloroflexales bacterium ZM16-3]
MEETFEPKILGMLCSWCAYAGADTAGVSRAQYPPNIRIVRVMCSGRIDPLFIARAFENGADGVLVAGCHQGDCHYISGNNYAQDRIELFANLLNFFGIDQRRLKLAWVSASEGTRFASVVTEMTEELRALGPLGLKVQR